MRTPPEQPIPRNQWPELSAVATMRIGEVSDRLGLSFRTIRYYEETRLAPPSGRTPGGFRLYSELDVQRLLLIMQMKPLGFSLERMRAALTALDLCHDPEQPEERRQRAFDQLAEFADEVDEQLSALRQRVQIAGSFHKYLRSELEGDAAAPH